MLGSHRSKLVLAALSVSVGCGGEESVEHAEPTPQSEPSPRSEEPVAPAGPEAPAPPRSRPTEPVPGERIGTVSAEGLGLEVGADAPNATLRTSEGSEVSLASVVARGPVMLVFYRGGWCPYCNFQVRTYTEAHERFVERGVTPVVVSVDRVEEAARTGAAYEIPFPVLSDPDLALHRAFRVVHEADDAEVQRLRGFGLDVAAHSGRDHHSFAVPSIFVIGGDGKILFRHIDTEYSVRPSVEQLLDVLDELDVSES